MVQNKEVDKLRQDFDGEAAEAKLGIEGYTKYMERVEAGIGRYLPGFRHYENFNNYNFMFPDSTIEEYRSEMYRQVELAEYISITRQAVLEEVGQPDFMQRNRLEGED
jgi:hypothetical protein